MNTETTPAPKDDERAKFEAWTKTQRRHIDIDTWDDVPGGLYCDDETSKLLEGWLARAASGAPQEAPGDAPSDSKMLDWLEANKDDVFHNGDDSWTVCYGPHRSKVALSLRAAISAAMKGPQ